MPSFVSAVVPYLPSKLHLRILFHILEIENPCNATTASSTLTMDVGPSPIVDEGVNQEERLTQLQSSVKTLLSWCDEYVLQL